MPRSLSAARARLHFRIRSLAGRVRRGRGRGAGAQAHRVPPRPTPPGSAALRGGPPPPAVPMAAEGVAGALAAVLGGRGLRVQNWDSGPSGESPALVRLRKNVCYVVLAVFLNEQVSVRPPAAAQAPERASAPVVIEDHLCVWRRPVLQSTLKLISEPCATRFCDCPHVQKRELRLRSLFHLTRPQFLEGGLCIPFFTLESDTLPTAEWALLKICPVLQISPLVPLDSNGTAQAYTRRLLTPRDAHIGADPCTRCCNSW